VATLEDVITADPKPMARPDQALEVREVYETIAQLPQDFRETLVAIDVLGLSYREAARALGVREATITTRLFRARQQIAGRLTAEPAPNEAENPRDRDDGRASVAPAREEQKRPSGVLRSREAP
jgi:RNA polymerase sigma-70 factor (ECF subfamily)